MSWYLNVTLTDREQFDAAVDAAEATGQDQSLPGVAEDVATAKDSMKLLAKRLKRPVLGGYANGHCLQRDEGPAWSDALAVSVHGAGIEPSPT